MSKFRFCGVCDARFPNLVSVKKHVQAVHAEEEVDEEMLTHYVFEATMAYAGCGQAKCWLKKEPLIVPELVNVFGNDHPLARYYVWIPSIQQNIRWLREDCPKMYVDLLERATWREDGADEWLVEAAAAE